MTAAELVRGNTKLVLGGDLVCMLFRSCTKRECF